MTIRCRTLAVRREHLRKKNTAISLWSATRGQRVVQCFTLLDARRVRQVTARHVAFGGWRPYQRRTILLAPSCEFDGETPTAVNARNLVLAAELAARPH